MDTKATVREHGLPLEDCSGRYITHGLLNKKQCEKREKKTHIQQNRLWI